MHEATRPAGVEIIDRDSRTFSKTPSDNHAQYICSVNRVPLSRMSFHRMRFRIIDSMGSKFSNVDEIKKGVVILAS